MFLTLFLNGCFLVFVCVTEIVSDESSLIFFEIKLVISYNCCCLTEWFSVRHVFVYSASSALIALFTLATQHWWLICSSHHIVCEFEAAPYGWCESWPLTRLQRITLLARDVCKLLITSYAWTIVQEPLPYEGHFVRTECFRKGLDALKNFMVLLDRNLT